MGFSDTDPVQRLLEFLSFRTVSMEGPNGSYNQVSSKTLSLLQRRTAI